MLFGASVVPGWTLGDLAESWTGWAVLDWVVGVCLAKDPNDRWQNAGDLGRQLKRIAAADDMMPAAVVVRRSIMRELAPWFPRVSLADGLRDLLRCAPAWAA